MRKIARVVLMILGIGLFMFGSQVASEAAQEEERVSLTEENEQDHKRAIIGPARNDRNEKATKNAQERIGDAEQTIAKSQVTANWLHGSGMALFIVGLGYLIFSFRSKKHS